LNSFYATTVDDVLAGMTLFLFLDLVLSIILQQGQRIASVSSQTSHQLHRFNPN